MIYIVVQKWKESEKFCGTLSFIEIEQIFLITPFTAHVKFNFFIIFLQVVFYLSKQKYIFFFFSYLKHVARIQTM